jgi:Uma2 family endonuclease
VRYTYEDYLRVEEESIVRHEYLDGQIYAMAGGTPEHSALIGAASGLLIPQLRGRCTGYVTELRVQTASGLSTYPDVTVICGPTERYLKDNNSIVNPTLILEVLSSSTEEYDRGDKFEHYKSISALQQYVLVSQKERVVEVWTREEGNLWTSAAYREGEIATLSSINAQLDVRELYETGTVR